MKRITILAFNESPLSSIALPTDIFHAAGTFWNRLHKQRLTPQFKVNIATLDGRPIRCQSTISITPDCSFAQLPKTDLLMIAPITDLGSPLLTDTKLHKKLVQLHEAGIILASICTGSFILAATRLLNNKSATTHWGVQRYFRRKYPEVDLTIDKTVTDEGSLLCSGGANAGADLSLYLVKKFCGNEIVHRCSRALLLDPNRSSQAQYERYDFSSKHNDISISKAQEWLEQNYAEDITINSLANQLAMSRRTFERRFKKATGISPIRYLQKLRIENAKILLETSDNSFDEITYSVGYEDPSTFRKVFQRNSGLSPSSYREKFSLS